MTHPLYPEIKDIVNQAVAVLASQGIVATPGWGTIKNHCGDASPYSLLDLTYLKSNGGTKEISDLCEKAVALKTKTVCVNPINVPIAVEKLKGTGVDVICVEGFPLGASSLENLIYCSNNNFKAGVKEVDIVFPHQFMVDKNYVGALAYLATFRQNVKGTIKVIFETSEYAKLEIAIMSLLCKEANMEFVKTSTGFSSSGATAFDIALMRVAVGDTIGVKASGGVRSIEDAIKMMDHGATRIGASGLQDTGDVTY